MAKTLRTEEWTFEVEGMISVGLINVFEGEVCHVTDELMLEMGFDPSKYPEDVEFESFYRVVPYAEFKDAVLDAGGSYAGTT